MTDNNNKKSHQSKVTDFMLLSGQFDPSHNVNLFSPSDRDIRCARLRLILLLEKVQLLFNAMLDDETQYKHFDPLFNILLNKINNINNEDFNLQIDEIAKTLSDIDYINTGTAVWLGIDSEAVFELVHNYNLTKMDPITNRSIKRSDGKVLEYKPLESLDLSINRNMWLKQNISSLD